MPITPKHAFKEKSTKLLILLPLRTIYNRTFQCETPCNPASTYVFDKSRIRGSKNKKLHFVADLQFKREETRLNLVPIGH